jgi:hypothetical protein
MVLKNTEKFIFFSQSLILLMVERIKKIKNKAKNKLSLS